MSGLFAAPLARGEASVASKWVLPEPQSDEAHSAFTPPAGVGQPEAPEEDHPSSEFAVPAGLAPEGTPVLTMPE